MENKKDQITKNNLEMILEITNSVWSYIKKFKPETPIRSTIKTICYVCFYVKISNVFIIPMIPNAISDTNTFILFLKSAGSLVDGKIAAIFLLLENIKTEYKDYLSDTNLLRKKNELLEENFNTAKHKLKINNETITKLRDDINDLKQENRSVKFENKFLKEEITNSKTKTVISPPIISIANITSCISILGTIYSWYVKTTFDTDHTEHTREVTKQLANMIKDLQLNDLKNRLDQDEIAPISEGLSSVEAIIKASERKG